MKYKAQFWNKKLDELEAIVTSAQRVETAVLNRWTADCVATFSQLGVDSAIIRGFMEMFKHATGYGGDRNWHAVFSDWSGPSRQRDRIAGFFYANIAFTTARALVQNLEEQERLVPQALIDLLQNSATYVPLADSLQSMESSYQSKDSEGLLASTQGLLQLIINLHPALSVMDRQGIKKQLSFLASKTNARVLDAFGVDAELIDLFQQFRYLRNKVSQHKKAGSTRTSMPKPPLAVGYGFSYLVLLFLYGVISRGMLVKI